MNLYLIIILIIVLILLGMYFIFRRFYKKIKVIMNYYMKILFN